jgi:hypothetical protein
MAIGVITIKKFKMIIQMTLKWCEILNDEVFNPTQSQKEKKNNH